MRPINLIPPDQRRGASAPLRSGPLVYVLIAALVAVLVGVAVFVVTGNQVSDRKSELARLKVEDARASAKARRLAAFTQFRTLREQRLRTIATLADSRFDWERVMRELALILPDDAWLVSLTATASPQVAMTGAEGEESELPLRDSVPGPALELSGCATGQEAVAGFVTSLKDIDGVTRVAVASSELPNKSSGAGSVGGTEGGGGAGDCRTRKFIAKFEIVVAFDAAPVPVVGSTEEAVAAPASEEPAATPEETTSTETSEGG